MKFFAQVNNSTIAKMRGQILQGLHYTQSHVYSETCQISNMEFFSNVVGQ